MSDIVMIALIAAVPGTIAAVGTLLNRQKIGEIGTQLDGRLTQFMTTLRDSSYAKGKKDEKDNSQNGKGNDSA